MLLQASRYSYSSSCSSNSSRHHHAVSQRSLLCSRPAFQPTATHTANHTRSTAVNRSSRMVLSSLDSRGSSIRSASIICRDAPRPMWARGPAPQIDAGWSDGGGGILKRMITREIADCDSLVDLANVYNEWGGSFDSIHAAAAFVKFAKLSRRGNNPELLQKLAQTWLKLLPDAGLRACANVLWSCASISKQQQQQLNALWAPTWNAHYELVAQDSSSSKTAPRESNIVPQQISNVMWAAAKLRKPWPAAELQLLVQTFLQPDILEAATAQEFANVVWAIGKLCQLPGWQGGVSEQDVQQLLGKEQLQLVGASDVQQPTTNVLIALVCMSGNAPLISIACAQSYGVPLLGMLPKQLSKWDTQHVTNALWACSELGLVDKQFLSAAVSAAPTWVPRSTGAEVTQAATACVQMQYRDETFLQLLLQQGLRLLQLPQGKQHGRVRGLSAFDKGSVAALCSISVAKLDMRNLAGLARDLVAALSPVRQLDVHPNSLRHMWVFHSWLLQHQLLDGKGLTGVLTQQQLQRGEKDAAVYGYDIKVGAATVA